MRFGMVTLSLSMILVGATAEAQRQLRVESMTSNNCRVVDHNGTTGDDSGGIAVSAQKVYYNGDSAAGEFNLNDLGAQRRVSGSARYSMISNLADGKLYALWNSQANQPVSTRTIMNGTACHPRIDHFKTYPVPNFAPVKDAIVWRFSV